MKGTFTVRLPEPLRKELLEISKAENIPVSDLVRDSISRFVLIRRFRKIRAKVLPFAEASGLLTDEDVFKAIP